MPNYTRLLCRMMQQYAPDATYTSLVVGTRPSLAHYDAHNDPFASNVILPLKLPLKGGHHWKELRNGDVVQGGIQPMTDARGSTFYGTVSRLQALVPSYLDPHQRHGVTAWEGDRVVLVGYTVNTVSRDVEWLQEFGFNVPEDLGAARENIFHLSQSNVRMFPVHVVLPEAHHTANSSPNQAVQGPVETASPPLSSREGNQRSPSEDTRSQMRKGGWSETVVVGNGEVEFNEHWDLKIRGAGEGSPASSGPRRPHSERTEGPRRRANPIMVKGPLPALPQGWSTNPNPSALEGCQSRLQDFNDDELEPSYVAPSMADMLKIRVTEEMEVYLASVSPRVGVMPQLCKAKPTYVEAPEEMFAAVQEPLQVVHTVSPKDVAQYPERWRPAISKEMQTVEVAIQRFKPGDEGYRELVSDPTAIRIPAKLVYTLKPPTQGATSGDAQGSPATIPDGFFRRKARIVGCGNYAPRSDLEAYASGSAPEAFRIVLAESVYRQWLLAPST